MVCTFRSLAFVSFLSYLSVVLIIIFLCSILRNNSFSGIIPREIGELKELEVLDLGCNNLSGPLPSELGNILPLKMLWDHATAYSLFTYFLFLKMVYFTYSSFCCSLLGNNNFFDTMPPELHKISMHSEIHVGENMLPGAANGASCNEIFSTRLRCFHLLYNFVPLVFFYFYFCFYNEGIFLRD